MSQTFENNALKAKAVAEGMLKHFDEISKYKVNAEDLQKLSEDTDKAIAMIKEVDMLRAEVSEKLQKANHALTNVKDRVREYRHLIKGYYP